MTQQILFSICAILSVMITLVHSVLGTPRILGPINETALPDLVKAITAYAWHTGTVLFFTLSVFYGVSAAMADAQIFALVASILYGAVFLLSLVLMVVSVPILRKAPGPYLSGVIALIGFIGFYA